MFFKRFSTFVTPQIPAFCPDSKIFYKYASRIGNQIRFPLKG